MNWNKHNDFSIYFNQMPLIPPHQIMNEYQPASQAASQRAVRGLPRLAVRPKDAAGEPGEGQALARAGEACTVW